MISGLVFVKLGFLLAFVLLLLFVFLWLCDRFQIDLYGNRSNHRQPAYSNMPRQQLYQHLGFHYENFANILWKCLWELQDKAEIVCPHESRRLYCADLMARVNQVDGKIVFQYECHKKAPRIEGGIQNLQTIDDFSAKELENMLAGNLPNYCLAGYIFQGPINVWELNKKRIRIEIHGVDRHGG